MRENICGEGASRALGTPGTKALAWEQSEVEDHSGGGGRAEQFPFLPEGGSFALGLPAHLVASRGCLELVRFVTRDLSCLSYYSVFEK